MKQNLKKLIGCQILAMLGAWGVLSFLQVVLQNCHGAPVYSWWNIFCLMVK